MSKEHEPMEELARDLPWRDLTSAEVERVRERLHEDILVEPQRKPWGKAPRLAAAGVGVAVAASIAAFAMFGGSAMTMEAPPATEDPSAQAAASAVVEGEGASFTHDRAENEEIIRLHSGRVRVRAPEGRSVRVIVGDGAIELRAHELEVVAQDDHISAVWARTGAAEVIRFGETPVMLRPGDRWVAPAMRERPVPAAAVRAPVKVAERTAPAMPRVKMRPIEAEVDTSTRSEMIAPKMAEPRPVLHVEYREERPMRPAVPEVKRAPVAVPAPQARDEKIFRAGWKLYRSEAWLEAAETLAKVDPRGQWSEDAAWWRAQAFVRARDEHRAAGAFRDLLKRHRRSRHAGEARVTLAWILVRLAEQGDSEARQREAKKLFEEAALDLSPDVRDSATRGLEALDR